MNPWFLTWWKIAQRWWVEIQIWRIEARIARKLRRQLQLPRRVKQDALNERFLRSTIGSGDIDPD